MICLRSHTMERAPTAYGETLNASGELSLSARSVPSMCVPDDAWRREQRTGEDRERGKPMTTIIDPVETGVMAPTALATSVTVTTTLYDLIATIQDVVGPDNDRLVVATVVYMLSVGSLILPSALDMQSSHILSSVADG